MATLTRSRLSHEGSEISGYPLDTSIPKPFPSNAEREQLLRDELLEELAKEKVELDINNGSHAGPSRLTELTHAPQESNRDVVSRMTHVPYYDVH